MAKYPGENEPKPVRWVGSSKVDLSGFPDEVRRRVGRLVGSSDRSQGTLREAEGSAMLAAGRSLTTLMATVRALHGRFPRAVYVPHAFQKKSKRGVAMPMVER